MSGSYKDVVHTAIFFKLPIKGTKDKILGWTTTPWTLSANVAMAVNPKGTYVRVKVKSDDSCLVLGKEALKVLKDDVVKVEAEFLGEELVGKVYETCFPHFAVQQFDHKIVPWDEVNALEGSGAVHIAPGCGAEDFELGKKHGLPEICPINDMGEMLEDYDLCLARRLSTL
jgi:isoleucyl-tRNA synthetase